MANEYWEYKLPAGFKRPTESSDAKLVGQFIRDKYVKRLYAPKDTLDPAAEYLEKRKNGIVVEPTPAAEVPEPEVAPPAQPKEIAPELLDLDFGAGKGAAGEAKGKSDLFSVFGDGFGSGTKTAAAEPTTKPAPAATPVKPGVAPPAVMQKTVPQPRPMIQPNKYAALDFVPGPMYSTNVYNIYNNVNMNISAGSGFGYGAQPPVGIQFQPTYSMPAIPKSDANDKAFKDVLPKDF